MIDLHQLISEFIQYMIRENIEIYNEFSLQHELGVFLRKKFEIFKIQFERNVKYFHNEEFIPFTKREIDVTMYSQNALGLFLAFELKFPQNGAYPEQMYQFCKDIAFSEDLLRAGWNQAATLIFVDDHLFYEGRGNGIYGYFRQGSPITGIIENRFGVGNVNIQGKYIASWQKIDDRRRYCLIEANLSA